MIQVRGGSCWCNSMLKNTSLQLIWCREKLVPVAILFLALQFPYFNRDPSTTKSSPVCTTKFSPETIELLVGFIGQMSCLPVPFHSMSFTIVYRFFRCLTVRLVSILTQQLSITSHNGSRLLIQSLLFSGVTRISPRVGLSLPQPPLVTPLLLLS